MKRAGGGFDFSYNAQTAVDETAHLIVAAEVSQEAADSGELPGMPRGDQGQRRGVSRAGACRCGLPKTRRCSSSSINQALS